MVDRVQQASMDHGCYFFTEENIKSPQFGEYRKRERVREGEGAKPRPSPFGKCGLMGEG